MGSSGITRYSGGVALPSSVSRRLEAAIHDVEVIARLTHEASSVNADTLRRLTAEAIRAIEDVNRRLAASSLTAEQQALVRGRLEDMLDYHERLLEACRRQGLSRIETALLPSPPRAWGTVDEFLDGLSLGGWNHVKHGETGTGVVGDFVDGLLLRPKRRT